MDTHCFTFEVAEIKKVSHIKLPTGTEKFIDQNQTLKNMIIKSKKETIINMRK